MEWIKSAERKLFFPFTAERVVKKAILPNWFCMAGNVLWHCDYANIVRRLLTPTPSKDEHFVISPDVRDNYCNATVMPWSRRLDINCMLVKSHSWRGRRRKFDGSVTEAELIGPKKTCKLIIISNIVLPCCPPPSWPTPLTARHHLINVLLSGSRWRHCSLLKIHIPINSCRQNAKSQLMMWASEV